MIQPLAAVLKVIKANQIQNDLNKVFSRVVPSSEFKQTDPFIILNHDRLGFPNGFGDHPHRGFQAVSYIKSGKMNHEDFFGHKSPKNAGDVAWITCGGGIVHAEMPDEDSEEVTAFQLWVNLSS
jgi:redox-sensitive bicupin YhaK (pirin superfamily)